MRDDPKRAHEAKALALLEEAAAARDQARLYLELAVTCRKRAAALHRNAEAGVAIAKLDDVSQHAQFAQSDADRAFRQARLNEQLAIRHEQEASRAAAEALRAEAEADTARSRARVQLSQETLARH
jgi:ABC-type Zn uptake system ZnuABC Zn-binding protein ZnuA